MDEKTRGLKTDTVFVFVLFCFFITSVLTVLIFGGNVYKKISDRSQEGYNERICISYIWTKVKNGDATGKVYADDFCGLKALYLEEDYEGVLYNTVIYSYNGWVYELFYEKNLEMSPEDGLRVIEAGALDFEQLGDGLIKICVNSVEVYIFPRGSSA